MAKIVYVVNTLEFFNSHRLPIALKVRSLGYDVHVIANLKGCEGANSDNITYHHVNFSRSGQNPFAEFITFLSLIFILFKIKPSLVHLVTIKPIIYGGIASRIIGVKSVVAAISGLGSVFTDHGIIAYLRLKLVSLLYKLSLGHNNIHVIFQNEDDKEKLLSMKRIKPSDYSIIWGSGVALEDFPFREEPKGQICISMAARLLKEKGVYEFVEAAEILKNRGVDVIMQVIGGIDSGNPTSISEKQIINWKNDGVVRFLGFRNDVSTLYSNSHIVCLPSYYGEGLPKSLIEAAACGRPVITTDMPGCRDAIIPNVTGFLIPAKNSIALSNKIELLVNDQGLRRNMGNEGRKLAQSKFNIENVIDSHVKIYKVLLSNV